MVGGDEGEGHHHHHEQHQYQQQPYPPHHVDSAGGRQQWSRLPQPSSQQQQQAVHVAASAAPTGASMATLMTGQKGHDSNLHHPHSGPSSWATTAKAIIGHDVTHQNSPSMLSHPISQHAQHQQQHHRMLQSRPQYASQAQGLGPAQLPPSSKTAGIVLPHVAVAYSGEDPLAPTYGAHISTLAQTYPPHPPQHQQVPSSWSTPNPTHHTGHTGGQVAASSSSSSSNSRGAKTIGGGYGNRGAERSRSARGANDLDLISNRQRLSPPVGSSATATVTGTVASEHKISQAGSSSRSANVDPSRFESRSSQPGSSVVAASGEGRFHPSQPSTTGIQKSASKPSEPSSSQTAIIKSESDSSSSTPVLNSKKRKASKPRESGDADTVITEKSCARCRIRKVKCDRAFPVCNNCKIRNEECDLISLHPNDKISMSAQDAAQTERLNRMEERLMEIEQQLGSTGEHDEPHEPVTVTWSSPASTSSSSARSQPQTALSRVEGARIGQQSVDWRLATPQLARSLTQHLCEGSFSRSACYACYARPNLTTVPCSLIVRSAFFSSCCFQMPSFDFFRASIPQYQQVDKLPGPIQVAIAAFCAVGARASPHSAVLGIAAAPDDGQSDPDLSAGSRRQSACQALVAQAHSLCYDHGLLEDASVETLAALIALTQTAAFSEFVPRKSKSLLRTAIAHYKELIETAANAARITELQSSFGLALYTLDALIAAYSRRMCMITESDLHHYFAQVSIVQPGLPHDSILNAFGSILRTTPSAEEGIQLAVHTLACWVAAAQRLFSRIASPPLAMNEVDISIRDLLQAVDDGRRGVEMLKRYIHEVGLTHEHHHHHGHGSNSETSPSSAASVAAAADHEKDYLARVIRCDRDLIDLIPMLRTFVLHLPSPGLPMLAHEMTNRVRQTIKLNAHYAREYLRGADRHMLYHHAFQLEHAADWTQLATQQYDPHDAKGPQSVADEVNADELNWLIEGLKGACYYTPKAEMRLQEMHSMLEANRNGGPGVVHVDVDAAHGHAWAQWMST
ncbi:BZ3500_MvSof-1268-A1-R1_Chr11-2g03389 [Microbotryum saponariae]|uniref:BZ3500_MvSof-1268-A1-R1_Chr11-2g03389 protein n=1 Tax=Microbotryum saponariae TaxID=289078 RepID=A0A2X0KNA8_9BASI|nr:BZ3500_MvSof-1268-A1-R1_Chr11-2g03389 [Microbotryum saponariae]SDA03265.1 BZ3501_MvSof-1269-A2-R1_Chr11g02960 [Microbotryum saponariae]